ncbi:tRNA pseudouridine(13) synthase TruD, partial [Candidatus Woesearchaeota archaeon]|nr:tRNA pseudouridine(13) synthase TruD [Candidatus Woesearchaeota archaeon]
MYELKHIPEDFIVEEIFEPRTCDGNYTYFSITKKNYSTMDAVRQVARALGVPMPKIGFAGAKDKRAITTQYMSVRGDYQLKLEKLNIKDLEIRVLGTSNAPISLGAHDGNRFRITIRNLDSADVDRIKKKIGRKKKIEYINYFGEQRISKNNVKIGRFLLQRKFKEACELINDPGVIEYLEKNPTDFLGAIRVQPRRIVSFYIHAYQSHIWNECAQKTKAKEVPIVGYATEFKDKDIEETAMHIIRSDGLELRDFIMREIPNMFTEGEMRKRTVSAQDVKIEEIVQDEFFNKKSKAVVSFSLPTGSYATEFIASL